MKTYEYIVNPKTGRKVSVYGKLGRSIIRNYMIGGATNWFNKGAKKGSDKGATIGANVGAKVGKSVGQAIGAVSGASVSALKNVKAPSFLKKTGIQMKSMARIKVLNAELESKKQLATVKNNKDNIAWKGISGNGRCRLCKQVDRSCEPTSVEKEIYEREIEKAKANVISADSAVNEATIAYTNGKGTLKAKNEAETLLEEAKNLVKALNKICPACVNIEIQPMGSSAV